MPVPSGTRFGPYEIVGPLGAGGMGEVYRARDTRLDRIVAFKIIAPGLADQPSRRQRFQREARAISSLSHPNICALYDVGEQDDAAFLVMEYSKGRRWRRGCCVVLFPETRCCAARAKSRERSTMPIVKGSSTAT